jgi:hypothetical protein
MRFLLTLFLVILPQAVESGRHAFDLEPLLKDPAALQKLKIMYLPPIRRGWGQVFVVRGDGSLILQAHPDRPMPVADIPTCTARVSQDAVKDLVRLIIQKRFFDLPERHFIFMDAAQGMEELEMHTIAIDDGLGKTRRTFGIGKFAGKEETIPPDFSAIEDELKRLRDSAFPPAGKICHFAPAITF